MPGAAVCSSVRPTSVEPVKESLRTRGSASMAPTTFDAWLEAKTFTTPAGTPASSRIAAMRSAVSGVSVAGLQTTAQPAASAGPIFRVSMAAGKFQGVTSTATPIGWCTTRMRFDPLGAVAISPVFRTASSANQRKNSAA